MLLGIVEMMGLESLLWPPNTPKHFDFPATPILAERLSVPQSITTIKTVRGHVRGVLRRLLALVEEWNAETLIG